MWIIYSLIMFSASVIQYLMVRRMQKAQVNNKLGTFMFLTPALPFIYIYTRIFGISLAVTVPTAGAILIATLLFSYLGIYYSFLGIEKAPNAGYSLMIQKSYAIYTALAAVLLFGSRLSFQGLLAITVIILFSGTIMLDKGKVRKVKGRGWLFYSILAFVLFGNLALFSKYMQIQGMNPVTLIFYVVLFFGLIGGAELYRLRKIINFKLTGTVWGWLICIGICAGIFNMAMQLAYASAPNIGYVNIINASSIAAITLLSAYFFKDKLSIEKVIGVMGVIVGLILLITV
jgi:drug/metabolite transporter (DMT)-like permease